MRGRFRFLTGSVLSPFSRLRILEPELASNVTAKGQVTLPKAAREAAGIRPEDIPSIDILLRKIGRQANLPT